MRCIIYSPYWLRTILLFVVKSAFYILTLAWGFRRYTALQEIVLPKSLAVDVTDLDVISTCKVIRK